MDTTVLIIAGIGIAIALVIAFALWRAADRNRTRSLRDRFGPEYENTVIDAGDRRAGEKELAQREKRVSRLDIRPLTDVQRQEYTERWRSVQAMFVDDPKGAVAQSDELVNRVMTSRGYPMGEWEARAADVSVDHPLVVANYREARRISSLNDSGGATTEDLRQAIVHYRALFEELLTPEPAAARR